MTCDHFEQCLTYNNNKTPVTTAVYPGGCAYCAKSFSCREVRVAASGRRITARLIVLVGAKIHTSELHANVRIAERCSLLKRLFVFRGHSRRQLCAHAEPDSSRVNLDHPSHGAVHTHLITAAPRDTSLSESSPVSEAARR